MSDTPVTPPTVRTLVVDDEASGRHVLSAMLQRYRPDLEVVGFADGVASARVAVSDHAPHLMFLDIGLGDGSGFDLLDAIEPRECEVIVVTADDSFIRHGFTYNLLGYLIKPLDPEQLHHAVVRAINVCRRVDRH
jgi:two-component system LytT family response regulator